MSNYDRGSADQWRVELNADDESAYAALTCDRLWNGYSIADLEPPYRDYAQIHLARRSAGPPASSCLFLRHPAFSAIIPHGDPGGLEAILAAATLPVTANLLARPPHVPVFERYYAFPNQPQAMLRLAADPQTFRPPDVPEPAVERLGTDDLPALLDLYASFQGNAFKPDQLLLGPFYGVRQGRALLAAGGTHAVGARYRIGAVGNFYTRPEVRGRGYGTAVVAAIVGELLAGPCRDVILNVSAANMVAQRLYRRLGFRVHCDYLEGRVMRREGLSAAANG